jgi:hypothetical protein
LCALRIPLAEYLDLLDWTGRQLRSDKRGKIPSHLAPILARIGLDGASWCEVVKKFGSMFKRAAGGSQSMNEEASRRKQSYMQAPGAPMFAP